MNTQEIKVTNAQTISINAKLQEKNIIPSLEKQDVLPDENYNGLSKVVVEAISLENKTVYPNKDTQTITPTESLGLSSVTIEPVSLESKSVVPSKEVQILNPSDEFIGFSEVVVDKIPNEYIIPEGNLNIISNGEYDVTNNASVKVNVDKQPNLQDKEARVTAPTNIFVHPDEDYDGLAFVNVIATVDAEQVEVTPTKEEQVLTPSEKTYFDSVTINPIPDEYIVPSGEMEITENGSYDVIDKAGVNVDIQPNLGTKTITENGTYNASDEGLDGYSNVEVTTSGANLEEYFHLDTEITGNTSSTNAGFLFTLKKIPAIKNTGTTCRNMFYGFKGEEVELSKFNTDNVTDMYSMFQNCSNLKNLDLSTINTSNVTTMYNMFKNCSSLTELDLSKFDTNNVTSMVEMFNGCSKLTNLNVGGWNTSKVTSMTNMFASCSSLTELDLSSFDISSCANTSVMFTMCTKLKKIDIRNFDFSSVTTYTNMFGASGSMGVPNSCEIIVKDDIAKEWVTSKFTRLTNVKTVAELGA